MGDYEEKFRKKLASRIKSAARDLINDADDIVGNTDYMTDLTITLSFPTATDDVYVVPTITISREHYSKEVIDLLLAEKEEG